MECWFFSLLISGLIKAPVSATIKHQRRGKKAHPTYNKPGKTSKFRTRLRVSTACALLLQNCEIKVCKTTMRCQGPSTHGTLQVVCVVLKLNPLTAQKAFQLSHISTASGSITLNYNSSWKMLA